MAGRSTVRNKRSTGHKISVIGLSAVNRMHPFNEAGKFSHVFIFVVALAGVALCQLVLYKIQW